MAFSENHSDIKLRGKAKGAEIILRERGLWPRSGWRNDVFGANRGPRPSVDGLVSADGLGSLT